MQGTMYIFGFSGVITLFWVYGLDLLEYLKKDFEGCIGIKLPFEGTGHRVQFLSMYFLHYLIAVALVGLMFSICIPVGEKVMAEAGQTMHTLIRLSNIFIITALMWEQFHIRMLPIHKNHVDTIAARLLALRTKYPVIFDSVQVLMLVNLSYIIIAFIKIVVIVFPPQQ